MSYHASYLTQENVARDPMDWNPEFSRRARGFASYAALRELGRTGVQELVERCCDCAAQLVAGLGELEGVEVLSSPIINQGLVAFPDPSGASPTSGTTKSSLRSRPRVLHSSPGQPLRTDAVRCASASPTGRPRPKT